MTPQSNATLAEIADALASHDDFAVCGHINPDGDCLGSQLALACALRKLGKHVTCLLADTSAVEPGMAFLPGAGSMVAADDYHEVPQVFVAVDVPTPDRLGEAARKLHAQAALTITIDHHGVPERMSDLSYTDADAPSTTMLIWEVAGHLLGAQGRDASIATCAYTGLMTDTGGFRYQNATVGSFAAASEMVAAGADPSAIARNVFQSRRLASVELEGRAIEHLRMLDEGRVALSWISQLDMEACEAQKADAEPLVDVLRSIAGVRVACMLREQKDVVRGSLRAKDDTDVSAIAREFNGGGHVAAAGLTIEAPLDEAVRIMEARLGSLFEGEVA